MSARPPPLDLVNSGWLGHIRIFVTRVLRSVPPGAGGSLSLSSWYRDYFENVRAGGAPDSQHLYAIAADLTGARDARDGFAQLAGLNRLVVVHGASYTHVQLYPAGALRRAGVQFPQSGDLLA